MSSPLTTVVHNADVCVVGGGIGGMFTAISAARHGAKVVLMQDRPVLGGNASSEIRMWISGAGTRVRDLQETGIMVELQMENMHRNPRRNFTTWDALLYEMVRFEPNIELLLNYCIRFYDRQFTTRKKENKGMLGSFEALLNDYFVSDKPAERGTLTVAYCADQLNLSANYFGDLIKKETGVSAQEYILTKIMDRAKELLTDPAKSVGDVAYALGYQYPQYFSKAFKRVVGCSPNEYRTLS
mgnify:CR=1 FL=1